MIFRRGMTALACGLVAAIGVAGAPQEASADKFVWVAKFACPAELDTFPPEADGGGFIGDFYFETVVNVYNADDDEVFLNKKIVLALRQSQLSSFTQGAGGASLISNPISHLLAPMDALAIDCTGVVNHLADSPDPRGSGFSPINPLEHAINGRLDGVIVVEALRPDLVVEALYGTATTSNGTGTSSGIHVNRVNAVMADGDLPIPPAEPPGDDDDSVGDDDDSVGDDDDSSGDDDDSSGDDDDSSGDDDDSAQQ